MTHNNPQVEWKEDPTHEYWTATYKYEWTFENVTQAFLSDTPVKRVSPPFGDGRWHISIGTIAKSPGFLGVFLGAAQDTEIRTSKQWQRRCETCVATLGTPNNPTLYGSKKNISGGYTFHAGLESRRGQAKYYKLEKLFSDQHFCIEQALIVQVEMSERRRTLSKPSPFGDIQHFASQSKMFLNFFDDPTCADVCFVFPKRKARDGVDRPEKVIYASKRVLRIATYFDAMFDSGFMESGEVQSQDEDDEIYTEDVTTPTSPVQASAPNLPAAEVSSPAASVIEGPDYDEDSDLELDDLNEVDHRLPKNASELMIDSMNLADRRTSDRPSKKRRISTGGTSATRGHGTSGSTSRYPGIQRITIRDTAYTTYRAFLLYLYSNSIAWAPLRSSYQFVLDHAAKKNKIIRRRNVWTRENAVKFTLALEMDDLEPTSPKSMYALADMLQVPELKEEAMKQIERSLTSENICNELASSFAVKYDAFAKIAFIHLRRHWATVSQSTGWAKLLNDGFENVNPHIRSKCFSFISSLQVPEEAPPSTTPA